MLSFNFESNKDEIMETSRQYKDELFFVLVFVWNFWVENLSVKSFAELNFGMPQYQKWRNPQPLFAKISK